METLGHTAEFSTKYAALVVNSEIEIATAILPGNFHPLMLPALTITIHPTFFPDGIEASLVGFGDTTETKVATVVDNYITDIFTPFIESFKDTHNEASDFISTISGKEVLWHPKMSENSFQGTWKETLDDTNLFDILKNSLKTAPLDKKINSLKLYIGRQPDGELSMECSLNNEPWNKGLSLLEKYANTWKDKGEFKGQKQFIMLRRCDKFD